MANSKIEEAAGALLRAWGTGSAPASNCAGVINELRKAYAAEVEAKEARRVESYRAFARDELRVNDGEGSYRSRDHEVDPEAAVVFAVYNDEPGAWVEMRVFIAASTVGDHTAS